MTLDVTNMDAAAIRRGLIERLSRDIAAMTLAQESGAGSGAVLEASRAHAAANTGFLKALIAVHGWPTTARFGEHAQAAAGWLLAFSAHIDPGFQNECLELLEQLLGKAELDAGFYAFTVDRTLLSQARPQRYGTQKSDRDGRTVIEHLEDPLLVNARRAHIGLPPLDLAPPARKCAAPPGRRRGKTTRLRKRNKRR